MAKVSLALYKGRKTIKTPKDLAFRIIEWVGNTQSYRRSIFSL